MGERFSAIRDDALGTYDTVGLIEALRSGAVSPSEIAQAARERADLSQPVINAIVQNVALPSPGTGTFAHVPLFIKDNEEVAGAPTRFGSRTTGTVPAEGSSELVTQFQVLGFSILGKSTMPEFGLTATTEPLLTGPTRNPRNTDHSTGGSSGGSAALVAADVVPMAHANDGGGSIRIPASCCGLVGLKPSRGRLVTRPDMQKLPVNITASGVVTRSVRDTALFVSEIERFKDDLPPVGHITGPSDRRLRIALVDEAMEGMPLADDVRQSVRDVATKCENLGHHVERIPFPFDPQFGRDFLRYWAALAFAVQVGGQAAFQDFDKDKLEPFAVELAGFLKHVAIRMPTTLRRLRQFPDVYANAMSDYDVVLSPVLSHGPPDIGWLGGKVDPHEHLVRLLRYATFTAIHNTAGTPAMSLPLGATESGLPIGVQVWGKFGDEATLLELAYELEQAIGWK